MDDLRPLLARPAAAGRRRNAGSNVALLLAVPAATLALFALSRTASSILHSPSLSSSSSGAAADTSPQAEGAEFSTASSTASCDDLWFKSECQDRSDCQWVSNSSTCLTTAGDDADDDSVTCAAITAEGSCQTSSACEWIDSSSTCLTKATDDDEGADDALLESTAAAATDDADDAVTCTAITAKGSCQTSSACEWRSSDGSCIASSSAAASAAAVLAALADPSGAGNVSAALLRNSSHHAMVRWGGAQCGTYPGMLLACTITFGLNRARMGGAALDATVAYRPLMGAANESWLFGAPVKLNGNHERAEVDVVRLRPGTEYEARLVTSFRDGPPEALAVGTFTTASSGVAEFDAGPIANITGRTPNYGVLYFDVQARAVVRRAIVVRRVFAAASFSRPRSVVAGGVVAACLRGRSLFSRPRGVVSGGGAAPAARAGKPVSRRSVAAVYQRARCAGCLCARSRVSASVRRARRGRWARSRASSRSTRPAGSCGTTKSSAPRASR